jgi:hypothetical protein
LLISEEECADGMGPDAQQYLLRFYGGLEISDPKGRGSLRITASDMPDFIVTLSFSSDTARVGRHIKRETIHFTVSR